VLETRDWGYSAHVKFHESEEKDKGLTLVPTVDGNILVGPSRIDSDAKDELSFFLSGLGELTRSWRRSNRSSMDKLYVLRAQRPNPYWVHETRLQGYNT
jgi:glycerol-3-phosphate dehydrogenase